MSHVAVCLRLQDAGSQQIGFLLGSCGVTVALTSDACHKGLPKSPTGEIPQFKGLAPSRTRCIVADTLWKHVCTCWSAPRSCPALLSAVLYLSQRYLYCVIQDFPAHSKTSPVIISNPVIIKARLHLQPQVVFRDTTLRSKAQTFPNTRKRATIRGGEVMPAAQRRGRGVATRLTFQSPSVG